MKKLMTLKEAAAHTPYGVETLRRAVHATDPHEWPHPLRALRGPRGAHLVRDVDLQDWIDRFPEA